MPVDVLATIIGERVIALDLLDRMAADKCARHFNVAAPVAPGAAVVFVFDHLAMAGAKLRGEAAAGPEMRDPEDVWIARLLFAIPVADDEGFDGIGGAGGRAQENERDGRAKRHAADRMQGLQI